MQFDILLERGLASERTSYTSLLFVALCASCAIRAGKRYEAQRSLAQTPPCGCAAQADVLKSQRDNDLLLDHPDVAIDDRVSVPLQV